MNKYDFGYSIDEATTNKWAFNVIKEKSKVLELGPAIGNLTKHLFEEKECIVDIIELDEEAGTKAKRFAREAILGDHNGNLNKDLWFDLLKDKRYDYIVALDVLEHLENPEHVLLLLKELLSDNGNIVLSIPNIAHNAVILELLSNEFPYSDLGLLDRTHIHFFAYHTIMQVIEKVGLQLSLIDSVQKVISDTEFNCNYRGLPVEVEHYLRTRKLGDVYQFLLVLEKEKRKQIDYLKEGILEDSLYESKAFVDGLLKNMVSVKGKLDNFEINVNIADYPQASSLRVVPAEGISVIVNLEVYAFDSKDRKVELDMNWTSGIKVDNHTAILSTKEYEINYLLEENFTRACIKGKCILIDDFAYQIYKKQTSDWGAILDNREIKIQELEVILDKKENQVQKLEVILDKKENQVQKLEVILDKKENQVQELSKVLENKELQIQELRKGIYLSQNELSSIKNTHIYKFFYKLYRIKGKVWRK